jgi:hypothetical protein
MKSLQALLKNQIANVSLLRSYRQLFLDAHFYNTLCAVTGMFSVFDSANRSTFGFANVPSLVAMTFIKPVQININSSAT